jgi:integrase
LASFKNSDVSERHEARRRKRISELHDIYVKPNQYSPILSPSYLPGVPTLDRCDALYRAGLRLMKCVQLRAKDLDLGYRQIHVRDSKEKKDRKTLMLQAVEEKRKAHLESVKRPYEKDLKSGLGYVKLSYALSENSQRTRPKRGAIFSSIY